MRPCKNPFLQLKHYCEFLLVKYAVVSPFQCFCLPYFSYKIPNFSPKFALKILIFAPEISPNFMRKSAGQPARPFCLLQAQSRQSRSVFKVNFIRKKKKKNIGHIFRFVRVRVFLFYMSIPCEKTFLLATSPRSLARSRSVLKVSFIKKKHWT